MTKEYLEIKNRILSRMDTKETIRLVSELLGFLMDLEDDIEDKKILKMYSEMKLYINDIIGVDI